MTINGPDFFYYVDGDNPSVGCNYVQWAQQMQATQFKYQQEQELVSKLVGPTEDIAIAVIVALCVFLCVYKLIKMRLAISSEEQRTKLEIAKLEYADISSSEPEVEL